MKTVSTKNAAILVAWLVASFALGGVAVPSRAATIHADGAVCTLADAIVAANSDAPTGGCPQGDAGADLVVLDADVTLAVADPLATVHGGVGAALPDVTDELTIRSGLGRVIQRDPGFTCSATTVDPIFRFLNLESGSLTLDGLRFENGCFVGAEATDQGGGIRAVASTELTLDGVTVTGHRAFSTVGSLEGGFLFTTGDRLTLLDTVFDDVQAEAAISLQGGAIAIESSDATARIQESTFADLVATTVGSSLQGGAVYSRAELIVEGSDFVDLVVDSGSSYQGGALYSSSSPARITRSSFSRLVATGGSSLQGGALYGSGNSLVLADVMFSEIDSTATNTCTGSALYSSVGGSLDRVLFEQAVCRGLTSGAEGGAARFNGSPVVLRDCVFRQNEVHAAGSSARGGAAFGSQIARIERCAFVDNRAVADGSAGGFDARGGALSIGRVDLMRNVTFAGNTARAADGVLVGADGGSSRGGGLFLSSGMQTSTLSSVTFTGNQAIAGEGADGFFDGEANGGGLFAAADHVVEVVGSILTDNTVVGASDIATPEDCAVDGTLTSLGYNLVEDPDASCPFTAFGDVTSLDPALYPVDDYGCAVALPDGSCVPTAAIDQTSWAIDWGSCAEAGVGEDARGLARRQDLVGVANLTADACDVGAFEARDRDGDGITDLTDLCPDEADPAQSDGDDDRVGDACDACDGDDATGDSDDDEVCDDIDVCAGFDDGADGDQDGVPDGCDLCLGDDVSGDGDLDLVCDDVDVCAGFDDGVDGDDDGVPDGCDVCAGDDATGDSDGDGVCDDRDASLGGRIWLDDGNGIQDGGEPGVAGVTVHLYSADVMWVESTTTDALGDYGFSPGPGLVHVEVVLPAGTAFAPRDQGTDDTADSDVAVASGTTSRIPLVAGQIVRSLDAGLEPAVIGNRVWFDANGDGRQQPREPGIGGVTVRLLDAVDVEVASTTTDVDGIYGFLGVATGTYRVEVVPPVGGIFSGRDLGGDDRIDSDVDPTTGRSDQFAYTADSASRGWDAGVGYPALFRDGFESGLPDGWSNAVP